MSNGSSLSLVLSCEHGGNQIPAKYRSLFRGNKEVLQTHRGYDPGALELAKRFAKRFNAPLTFETRSRLLIEMNRSLSHPRLFSQFSRELSADEKEMLIKAIYHPYRNAVIENIQAAMRSGPIFHLSVHSFTPVLDGKRRRTDIGLLFDPQRELESAICSEWKRKLKKASPDLAVHFNLPYRGTSDGFTTALRQKFPDQQYAGIELEVNQKFPLGKVTEWKQIQNLLLDTLEGFKQWHA